MIEMTKEFGEWEREYNNRDNDGFYSDKERSNTRDTWLKKHPNLGINDFVNRVIINKENDFDESGD